MCFFTCSYFISLSSCWCSHPNLYLVITIYPPLAVFIIIVAFIFWLYIWNFPEVYLHLFSSFNMLIYFVLHLYNIQHFHIAFLICYFLFYLLIITFSVFWSTTFFFWSFITFFVVSVICLIFCLPSLSSLPKGLYATSLILFWTLTCPYNSSSLLYFTSVTFPCNLSL